MDDEAVGDRIVGMLGDDTDEVRQQSCVKSQVWSSLLSAASIEQPENKTDRYGQTIPFFSSTKRIHLPHPSPLRETI